MTKNTCYFTLHRVRNIDVHDVENSISGPLDFKMGMPPDPPRGSRLRHSDLITPLINIPVNTNTPLKTSATRLTVWTDSKPVNNLLIFPLSKSIFIIVDLIGDCLRQGFKLYWLQKNHLRNVTINGNLCFVTHVLKECHYSYLFSLKYDNVWI